MGGIGDFLAMGGHAAYVWPAYGVAVVVLAALVASSLRTLRAREAEIEVLEARRPPRRRRARQDDPGVPDGDA